MDGQEVREKIMKCDCLTDIEKKLAAKYTDELGVEVKVDCQNMAFSIVNLSFDTTHFTNYKITAPVKGFTKGKIMPVHANYCPFCGKSVNEEAES
jgi:hypothetical protein